jgi:hypothetical protein
LADNGARHVLYFVCVLDRLLSTPVKLKPPVGTTAGFALGALNAVNPDVGKEKGRWAVLGLR